MSGETRPIFPVAEQVSYARKLAEEEGRAEVHVAGVPDVEMFVDHDGGIFVTILCDPSSVIEDKTRPAFRITSVAKGAMVAIAKNIGTTVAAAALTTIVSRIVEGEPRGRVPVTVLREFDGLLAGEAGRRLSDNQLVGLLGELEVLREVVAAGGGLDHWTGHLNDHVDFRLPGMALEVKSTLSANHRRVVVHGLRQLEAPDDGSDLFLLLRRFERSPDGPDSNSVPEVVDQLIGMGVAAHELLEALSGHGYLQAHADDYVDKRFVGTERALRLVDDSHPRLTESLLKRAEVDLSGIDGVDYVLDLDDSVADDLNTELGALLASRMDAG